MERAPRERSVSDDEEPRMYSQAKKTKIEYQLSASSPTIQLETKTDINGASPNLHAVTPPIQYITYTPTQDPVPSPPYQFMSYTPSPPQQSPAPTPFEGQTMSQPVLFSGCPVPLEDYYGSIGRAGIQRPVPKLALDVSSPPKGNISLASGVSAPSTSGFSGRSPTGANGSTASAFHGSASAGYNGPWSPGFNVLEPSGYNGPSSPGFVGPFVTLSSGWNVSLTPGLYVSSSAGLNDYHGVLKSAAQQPFVSEQASRGFREGIVPLHHSELGMRTTLDERRAAQLGNSGNSGNGVKPTSTANEQMVEQNDNWNARQGFPRCIGLDEEDPELAAITRNMEKATLEASRYRACEMPPSGRSSLPRNRLRPQPTMTYRNGEPLLCVGELGEAVCSSGSRVGQEEPSQSVHHLALQDPLQPSNNNSTEIQRNMSSPRPKSPRPGTPKKEDESFWDKLGTLGRKKRIKEVQEFEQEGKNAIESPGSPTQFDIPPEDYDLAEGEERSLIERRSYADPKLQHLIGLLIDWINDELADQRIIVKSIEDDLYDGQILQKLLEKLTGQKLEIPEVSQSEEGQRNKLEVVLNTATHVVGLPRWNPQKWSVESIHSKSLVAILYLLVTLARHFRAPLRLPENVIVETVVVKKRGGKLDYRRVAEEITSTYDEFGMRCERDAFDSLLDHAPDKLQVVKKSLITFVNKHLNKINLEVTDIENQFHDGVYLILLMGLLEGYFVPLFEFHVTPKDFEQKVFNVSFAFELIQDAGISKPKARPEDIVNLDLKSTLRVLYNLFSKYKHI